VQPDLTHFAFRKVHSVDPVEFSARLRRTDVYMQPLDDVDGFTRQLEQSVTDILDILAPLKTCTKRRGKADCLLFVVCLFIICTEPTLISIQYKLQ